MLSPRLPVVIAVTALLAADTRSAPSPIAAAGRPSARAGASAWEGSVEAMRGLAPPTVDEGTDDEAGGEDLDGAVDGEGDGAEEGDGEDASVEGTDAGEEDSTQGAEEGTEGAGGTAGEGGSGDEGTDDDPDASSVGGSRVSPRERTSTAEAEGPAAPVPLPERDALGCEGDRNCRALTVVGTVFGGVSLVALGAGISLLVRPDRIIPEEPAYAISTKPAGMVLATLGGGALMTAVLMLVSGRKRGRSAAPQSEYEALAEVTP